MKREFALSSRREFFGQAAGTMAILGVIASQRAAGAVAPAKNPFAYDVSQLQSTDPKLLSHAEVALWQAPHAEAKRLALAPDNTLYVCSGNYLTALNHSGARGLEIATPEPTRCCAIAPDGTIYLGLRNRIEVFDAKGKRQATWDSPAKKSWFTGIALSDTEVFVADAGQRVILCYDQSGKLRRRLGEKNKERNIPGFILPSPFFHVALAPDGLLHVNNPGRHRMERYTTAGDFEGSWGETGMSVPRFCGCCNPISFALASDGKYVTAEKGLPRVKIYSATGEFESVVAGVETFSENARACGPSDCTAGGLDVAMDSQGRIYILDLVTGGIRVMQRKA
jgi:sugar lactone lactonase YvrE